MAKDDDERSAHAAYMVEYRRNHPDVIQKAKIASRARQRAFRALARAHRDEFRMLLNQERRAVGLPAYRGDVP